MDRQRITTSVQSTNLADILERVLDKGIVIAGDIRIQLADVELLNIKIRLLIASVDKAKEIGISWWENDPYLSPKAKDLELARENTKLTKRIEWLEEKMKTKMKTPNSRSASWRIATGRAKSKSKTK